MIKVASQLHLPLALPRQAMSDWTSDLLYLNASRFGSQLPGSISKFAEHDADTRRDLDSQIAVQVLKLLVTKTF